MSQIDGVTYFKYSIAMNTTRVRGTGPVAQSVNPDSFLYQSSSSSSSSSLPPLGQRYDVIYGLAVSVSSFLSDLSTFFILPCLYPVTKTNDLRPVLHYHATDRSLVYLTHTLPFYYRNVRMHLPPLLTSSSTEYCHGINPNQNQAKPTANEIESNRILFTNQSILLIKACGTIPLQLASRQYENANKLHVFSTIQYASLSFLTLYSSLSTMSLSLSLSLSRLCLRFV